MIEYKAPKEEGAPRGLPAFNILKTCSCYNLTDKNSKESFFLFFIGIGYSQVVGESEERVFAFGLKGIYDFCLFVYFLHKFAF